VVTWEMVHQQKGTLGVGQRGGFMGFILEYTE